jgi:hypothetical protein
MNSPVSEGKGISTTKLENRTKAKATPKVTAFTKPDGLAKAVKKAMNDPSYVPGTAQKIPVDLTPSKKTGKLPTAMVATKGGATQKMAVTKATVEFGPGGQLKTAFPDKKGLVAKPAKVPAPVGNKPAVPAPKAAKPTLSQIANKPAKK